MITTNELKQQSLFSADPEKLGSKKLTETELSQDYRMRSLSIIKRNSMIVIIM